MAQRHPDIILDGLTLRTGMHEGPQLDPALRRRMRYAERKLKDARQRLAQTERGIVYWSRVLADLKHERTRAVQPPLWPEEETNDKN
jgi:hypothetical protein